MSRTVRNSTLTFTQEFPKSGILEVPREIYSSSESIVIEGILNHFPFRTELRKNELKFSSGMQTAARVKPGKEATVEITRVGKEEEVRVPADGAMPVLSASMARPCAASGSMRCSTARPARSIRLMSCHPGRYDRRGRAAADATSARRRASGGRRDAGTGPRRATAPT